MIFLKPEIQLRQGDFLFDKIEDAEIEKQLEKLAATKRNNEAKNKFHEPDQNEDITYEEFSKLDIRSGKVLTAEKVAKTKKLMKLTIDTGIDTRTVVSGIAEYYEPEQVVGQTVSVIVNLQPQQTKRNRFSRNDTDGFRCRWSIGFCFTNRRCQKWF